MRTYTLESVEKKIANVRQFIRRAAKKENLLFVLEKIRDDLLSPENAEKAILVLDRKRKEMARLEATISAAYASGALVDPTEETETESVETETEA